MLLEYLGHYPRADRPAALADREAERLVHRDRLDQLDLHLGGVARHHHYGALRKLLDEGQAGDNVGCLLRGTKREEIERGQVLAKPGSITPHTKFKAEVYCLTKDEGGRHTPFFNGYRPQFYFRTTDVTGVVTLAEGTEMVMPGDNTQMEIELIQPIAMDEALRFAIREGGRTVGSGVVTEVIE